MRWRRVSSLAAPSAARWARMAHRAMIVFLVVCLASQRARAQAVPGENTIRLDSLRFSGIGVQIGMASPLHVETARTYSLVTDYGEIARGYRVVFTATYWGSRFDRRTTRMFADSLRRAVIDPSGDDSVRVTDIDVSDISLAADIRKRLGASPWFRPFLGGGLALHVLNADGPLIDGTLAERSIDNLAVGVAAVAGLDLVFLGHVAFGAQARYDLLSLARFASMRAGVTYYFDSATRRGTSTR